MTGFQQIQDTLDRILGTGTLPNHKAFWRGRTRDEFVTHSVLGLPIISLGRPEDSNLVKSLRGFAPFGSDLTPPPRGAFMPRMPARRAPASEADIALIEEWIRNGCPETGTAAGALAAAEAVPPSDSGHVRYWRAVDDFFLPGLASDETGRHVGNMHARAFLEWAPAMIGGGDRGKWLSHLATAEVAESFEYIRHHQRRLIQEFYGGLQDSVFDSLWKFGGNLLPADPQSHVFPQHTMNGIRDWFFWCPYLDASQNVSDANAVDVALGRAWQVGIVADGLLRTDADRPVGGRMPISDFAGTDSNLRANVFAKYSTASNATMLSEMVRRARESRLFGY